MPAYTLTLLLLLFTHQCLAARFVGTDVEVVGESIAKANDAPWFCRGAPCPPFKVISKEQTYELREYAESAFSGIQDSLVFFESS